jgi:phosphohistidine phosphatase SixA
MCEAATTGIVESTTIAHALRERLIAFITFLTSTSYRPQSTFAMSFAIDKAREHFPALQQDQVFLDNAGGSQALGDVIDS